MKLLSVVMPVRNAMPHLDLAVTSILNQTRGDFEFIIGNDGSDDGSGERLRHWAERDSRIRLMESAQGQGPVRSSNWVANAANTPLVARMDADDIAHPDRLRRQVEVLQANPHAVLVAPLFDSIDENGRLIRESDRGRLLRPASGPPIAHGSIMYRRDAFDRSGGYALEAEYFEDLDLYDRIAGQGKLLVLLDSLYRYRFSSCSARLNTDQDRVERVLDAYLRKTGGSAIDADCAKGTPTKRLRPEALKVIGSLRLWSGKRPDVLGQVLKRGELRLDASSLKILVWALWGEVSPGSLRGVLRFASQLRERRARRELRDRHLYEWRPPLRLDD